jgi:hypothetical protein
MFDRRVRSVLSVLIAVIVLAGSAALYARQQAAGSVLPAKFLIINQTPAEAVPVSLAGIDPKFPIMSVEVLRAQPVDLTDATIGRLQPPSRRNWEYQAILVPEADPTARLNVVGRDGWELVSVVPAGARGNTYLFKRPR